LHCLRNHKEAKEVENLNLKTSALILLILALGIGAFGGFMYGQTYVVQPLHEHQAITDSIVIHDTRYDSYLTPKCVDAGSRIYNEGKPLAVFIDGRSYEQSTWLWQRYGDTEIVMTIWGPGEDHKTVSVEFGKVAANPFDIKLLGETIIQMPYEHIEFYFEAQIP